MTNEIQIPERIKNLRGEDLRLYLQAAEELLAEARLKQAQRETNFQPQIPREPTALIQDFYPEELQIPLSEPAIQPDIYEAPLVSKPIVEPEPQPVYETPAYYQEPGETAHAAAADARFRMRTRKPKKEKSIMGYPLKGAALALTAAFSLYTYGGNKNKDYSPGPVLPPAKSEPKPSFPANLTKKIIDRRNQPAPKSKHRFLPNLFAPHTKDEPSKNTGSDGLKNVLKPKKINPSATPSEIPTNISPEKWTPSENAKYDDNNLLRIGPSETKPGILDLFYKNEKGDWEQYNNLVPVAFVGLDKDGNPNPEGGNAELANAAPERTVRTNPDGSKSLIYQYPPLPNGAHFYLEIEMSQNKKEVKISAYPNPDSSEIKLFTPGNFFGLVDDASQIKIGDQVINASDFPPPNDGIGIKGNFVTKKYKLNPYQKAYLIGQKYKQYQYSPESRMLEFEVRNKTWTWDQQSLAPGKNWFEAFQTRTLTPLGPEGATWYLGVEGMEKSSPMLSLITHEQNVKSAEQKIAFEKDIRGKTESIVNTLVADNQKDAARFAIPLIANALFDEGIYSPEVLAYAVATLESEVGFEPIKEIDAENQAKKLNYPDKIHVGYGYIQLTGPDNYRIIGDYLGIDLYDNPLLLMDPEISAKAFAAYMAIFGTADKIIHGDLQGARYTFNIGEKTSTDPKFRDNYKKIADRYYKFYEIIKNLPNNNNKPENTQAKKLP